MLYNISMRWRIVMDNLSVLEECYKKYIKNLSEWIPEGVQIVDLALLQRHGLLNYNAREMHDPSLTRYFHVIESSEKITLINEQFIVWIVPEKFQNTALTYTLIALNSPGQPHLEMAFVVSGVYNTSRLVLRILEKFLQEIQENEEMLSKFKKAS